jgi:hypothetical protein
MTALIAVLVALASPARAADRPGDRVDAQMLLDLDLLAEGDPARHRDQSVAERMRMLEMLGLLESPAGATPARRSSTPAARPSPTPPAPADAGSK